MGHLDDTGIDSDQDHDFGNDGNPGLSFYESPIVLSEETIEVPEFGTFLLPICTTRERLLDMISTIRAGAIVRGLSPVGDYNIDLIKSIEALNDPALAVCFDESEFAMSCEDIADCIENEEVVQNAITNNYNIMIEILMANANSGTGDIPAIDSETSTIHNTPFASGTLGTVDDPIKDLENCNLNALWAGIREGIVLRLDDNARSMLEFLVTKADLAERATALIGAIPIFGSMAQAVLDQMVEAAPDMLSLFDSYSSIDNMDTIACEIFAIVCSECRYPTMEEVYSYYAQFGITGMDDLNDIVISTATDLLFGSTELVALAFYHTMISYQIFILLLGSKFHGATGSAAIVRMAELGEDSANNNWETLCNTCNESYQLWTWDFTTQGIGDFYADPINVTSKALFIAGEGWRAVNHSTGRRLDVAWRHNPAWEIRAVALMVDASVIAPTRNWVRRPTWQSATGQSASGAGNAGTEWTHYWDGYVSIAGFNELLISMSWTSPTQLATLQKIAILYNTGFSNTPSVPTADVTPFT